MKRLILALMLTLPALSEEVRIRQQPSQTRVIVREGVIWCPLLPLATELGIEVHQSGPGYSLGDKAEPVDAGQLRLPDGKRLGLQEDSGEPIVNAEEFCKALGGKVTQPERGVIALYPPPPKAGPVRRDDPSSFFISQVRSSFNPTGTVDNSNCGPASLAMAARVFGKWPLEIADSDYPAMMSWIRRAMGHKTDEMQGTNIPWLTKAADKLHLSNSLFTDFNQLSPQLAQGRMVIVSGYMKNLNMPGGSHTMLVVAERGDDFLVNDPGLFFKRPGTAIPNADLKRFFVLGIAVGAP